MTVSFRIRSFLASCILPLVAAAELPSNTVSKAAANYAARNSVGANFTYTESFRNLNFNAKGKTTLDLSDKFEIVMLEGAPYYRHIEHDGKPLSSREKEKEDQKMKDIAKARRVGNRKAGLYPHGLSIALPIGDLPKSFGLKAAGEVVLNGRKTYVIEASPSAELIVAPGDSLAKVIQMRLWIDEQDLEFAKVRAEVVRTGTRYGVGAVIETDYEKVRDEVWLRKRFHFKGDVADGSHMVPAEAEQICSEFRKFSSSSEIVIQ